MKSAEGIPDKCKVWVHPMLHGDSPFSDLSKIKRHASNKKSNRFPAPPMFPDTQPRHLARDAISYPLEAYLPSRYRHPSSEVDDRTPSPHPRYSYSSRSESEGPSFEAAPVSRPTSRPQLKLVTALNDHDLSASRGGLQHHRSSSVPNSLPAAITSAPDEVMRSPVEVDHSDRRERALSAFPLSSRVIASAQLDEAACGNISSTAFPIFQLEQPVFDGADSCEDRKDLRKGSLNDLMQVVFR